MPNKDEKYEEKEAQERFEAALRGGLKTEPKPLKEKSKVRANKKPKKNARDS